ncbi:MAG: amidohydrolase family protein [Candidatus Auribacterota bacterium]
MRIIDFHTHAFPDTIAPQAMKTLQEGADCTAFLNGTVADLLRSMDSAGIRTAVLASIATKPEQFSAILRWSGSVASERIVPFPSVHPDDTLGVEHVHHVADLGFKGIKLHPYYQKFVLDDERMMPLYAAMNERGLIVLCHTGFDIAFPHDRICDPQKIAVVKYRFPALKFVCSHLGAWDDWDEVEKYIIGKEIYMEMSYSQGYLPDERIRSFLTAHPKDYILFGTDSPWMDQSQAVRFARSLKLSPDRESALFSENASRLLGI